MEKSDLVEDLMEARAKAEAANVAKSAFLATISHELRTPLNAVLGFAQVLENEIHGPLGHRKYREYLRHMSGSGIHLLNLIDELLEPSRAESGSLTLREEVSVDLATELFFADGDHYDGLHTSPRGSDKIGCYLFAKLRHLGG